MDSQREIISRRMAQEERNRRIKHLKRLIVVGAVALLVLPTICCFIFMFRLNRVERKMDNLMMLYSDNYKEYTEYMQAKNNGVVYAAGSLATSIPEHKENNAKTSAKATAKPEAPEGKKVYLTFDDGPSVNTDDILDILKENNVKATFFCIGRTDEHSKDMYKRIVEEGNTLAMHSYSHKYSSIYSSVKTFKKDLNRIQTLLYDVTGQKPVYYRFPGGSSNTVSKVDMKKFISCLNDEGITYFDWNVVNGDATTSNTIPTDELIKNVMNGIKMYDTSVVLMHDAGTKGTTVKALPEIIKKVKKQGASILPIDESTKLVQHVKADSVD